MSTEDARDQNRHRSQLCKLWARQNDEARRAAPVIRSVLEVTVTRDETGRSLNLEPGGAKRRTAAATRQVLAPQRKFGCAEKEMPGAAPRSPSHAKIHSNTRKPCSRRDAISAPAPPRAPLYLTSQSAPNSGTIA